MTLAVILTFLVVGGVILILWGVRRSKARSAWFDAAYKRVDELDAALTGPIYRVIRPEGAGGSCPFEIQKREHWRPWDTCWSGPKTPPWNPEPRWRTLQRVESATEGRRIVQKWCRPGPPEEMTCFDAQGKEIACVD